MKKLIVPIALLALAACGGGAAIGSGGPPEPIPTTTTQSIKDYCVQEFTAWDQRNPAYADDKTPEQECNEGMAAGAITTKADVDAWVKVADSLTTGS